VDQLLAAKRRAPRPDVVLLQTGHVPTMRDEAAAVAEETTRLVWRTVQGDEVPPGAGPAPETLDRVSREEWSRAPRTALDDRRAYWSDYLLGGGDAELGFDVMMWVDGYRDLMAAQARLLDLRPGQVLLDAGGGTGNFLKHLLKSPGPLPARVEIVDLVPEALERARRAGAERARQRGVELHFRTMSLEVSRLRPVERFVRGEAYGPAWLRGRIEGLEDEVLDRILELYGPAMHAALRGFGLDARLRELLTEAELAVVSDLGRAARMVRGTLREDDFRPGARVGGESPRSGQVRFERLVFGDAAVDEQPALGDEQYDRALASLILPYLSNPDETVRELYRALRPGGRLVVSANRPNTDMSIMFTEAVQGVAEGVLQPPPGFTREQFLDELRAQSNSAAFLLRLADERTFRWLDGEELRALLEGAGFGAVEVQASFGTPPQAFVAVGVKQEGFLA
jgi:ubiquinone/menaquinone biosynthesis C-methylase UbiE